MIIDLREIPVIWINLDSATKNAEIMQNRFEKYGFKNIHRKSGLIIPPPEGTPRDIYHFMGCGQSHIDILESLQYDTPLLILEDDVEFAEDFNPIIDIPDDSDGIYLGVSSGNRYYASKRYNENYLRIGGILAAHAILYVTPTYRQNMADVGNHCLNVLQQPWDLGTAQIQFYHRVYATNQPLFYQSNNRENANKWQGFTDCGLEDRNTEFPV
jgi:hypothetical protein